MKRLPYKFEKCPVCGSVNLKISTPKRALGMIGDCQCRDCGFHVNTSNDMKIPTTFSTEFHARKAVRLIWNAVVKDFLNLSEYEKQFVRTKEALCK